MTADHIIEKIREALEGDHDRLCQGREYTCTCGHDDAVQQALTAALQSAAEAPASLPDLPTLTSSGSLEGEALNPQWAASVGTEPADARHSKLLVYSNQASNYNPGGNLIGGESPAADTPPPSAHLRVPEGYVLVPIKPTREMAYQAACYFYGKRRVDRSGGIGGIAMTSDGTDHDFWFAFKKFWRAAIANAPQPAATATEDGR
jgi:hypothetical protein